MFQIEVSDRIKNACPKFAGVAILAKVKNEFYSEDLWIEINDSISRYKQKTTLEEVKKNPAILATRDVYKKLGKDPNRYRPSGEALCRRIVRELSLYQIDNLVDIINLVSIETGYSIGGFDADKIAGNSLLLGVGEADEPYEAIGRGLLNIENMPVYRDEAGGIGTPTSDNERTKLSVDTTRLLVIINGYDGDNSRVSEAGAYMRQLLEKHVSATDFEELCF